MLHLTKKQQYLIYNAAFKKKLAIEYEFKVDSGRNRVCIRHETDVIFTYTSY